ncbi:hypothetical protein Asppvi_010840 [Aspergillus pseudoviridinutans]|uniref:Uncharacterized protein n=1 Tax=Aspergillus pseudoviridinutans TaxID=1517512 RepID=A0A9P3BIF3_9EURO|nr:uncharacterized protein Asppvi_010840 [Aspergillus pseudoviridinutans]GIJ91865.1 hypothetical protein Asppvi_010840 [Aspergillus pseudoviridinutans]
MTAVPNRCPRDFAQVVGVGPSAALECSMFPQLEYRKFPSQQDDNIPTRAGDVGKLESTTNPALHATPVKFACTLCTIKIGRIIRVMLQADTAIYIGDLAALTERAKRHRMNSTILRLRDGHRSQPGS